MTKSKLVYSRFNPWYFCLYLTFCGFYRMYLVDSSQFDLIYLKLTYSREIEGFILWNWKKCIWVADYYNHSFKFCIFFLLFQNTTSDTGSNDDGSDGPFVWETDIQGYILSSFFYGYVITQIPFGLLSKKYGSIYFLGVGMLINSIFGLLVPVAANLNIWALIAVRFIQGLGEVSNGTAQVQSES